MKSPAQKLEKQLKKILQKKTAKFVYNYCVDHIDPNNATLEELDRLEDEALFYLLELAEKTKSDNSIFWNLPV